MYLHLFYNYTAKLFTNEAYIHSIQDPTPNIDTYHSPQNRWPFSPSAAGLTNLDILIGNS